MSRNSVASATGTVKDAGDEALLGEIVRELGIEEPETFPDYLNQLCYDTEDELTGLAVANMPMPAHIAQIANVLQDVADGKRQRLMILTPPSHGLTALLKYFLAYLRERNALNRKNAPLWYATSSTESAQRVAGQALSLSDIGNQGILATAAGHPITGYAFHTAIVDSPYPNTDSASYTEYRDWINDWFYDDVVTRKHKPNSPIVVASSRYHWGDLAGDLLGTRRELDPAGPWHVVYMPIFGGFPLPRYLKESCDKFGTTVETDEREKGEILCPSFFSLNDLSGMRLQMGEEAWQSQWELDPL